MRESLTQQLPLRFGLAHYQQQIHQSFRHYAHKLSLRQKLMIRLSGDLVRGAVQKLKFQQTHQNINNSQ